MTLSTDRADFRVTEPSVFSSSEEEEELTPLHAEDEGLVPKSTFNEEELQLKRHTREEEEEPYFDASMKPTYTAYIGKNAVMTCIVHAVKNAKSVSIINSAGVLILYTNPFNAVVPNRWAPDDLVKQ